MEKKDNKKETLFVQIDEILDIAKKTPDDYLLYYI